MLCYIVGKIVPRSRNPSGCCLCVLCCVMRPKAGLIVGKQTCGSFNLLYTTIRPIIGLASREYKHRMLATADTTAVAASCTDLALPIHHFRCTFYIKSKLPIRSIKHDGGEWCALHRCVMQATGDLDSGPALRILCYSHRSVTSLIPTLYRPYTLYL